MADNCAELSEDLIMDEILVRLPVESIGRCRCVSKPWRRSLSSPRFTKAHLERHVDNPQRILFSALYIDAFYVTTLSRSSGGDNIAVSRPVNFPFYKTGGLHLHVGSCHGLVLFSGTRLILVNPITLEAREIPNHSSVSFTSWGFGYDSFRDDYKIVGLNKQAQVHIYSLKTETWRVADSPHHYCSPHFYYNPGGNSGMFVNGRIHWTAYKRDSISSRSDHRVIATFNLGTEEFENVPIPVDIPGREWRLSVVDGCLAIAVSAISVWVMKEYGDSWVKLSVIPNRPIDVICRLGEDEILVTNTHKLEIYNLRSLDWKDFAAAGVIFPVYKVIAFREASCLPIMYSNICTDHKFASLFLICDFH